MVRALVLNATYEPLCVVSARRAICLLIAGKAEMIAASDGEFRSERAVMSSPSVVRLSHVVRVPRQRRAAMSRRAVFARDGHRCQYCGAHADSLDHVVPRSRGGQHSWENVVAACRPCNARKRDRFLEETTMRLARRPVAPRDHWWVWAHVPAIPDEWAPYLAWGAGSRSTTAA
jgi:5-methylcytosine-specific restriction endonuclease McrA